MANFGLTVPNEKAVFRYEYRDTGGAWSSSLLMSGGAADQDKTFASPVCDELRITATYATAATFNRVHFSRLTITSGLVFTLNYGASDIVTIQTVETRVENTQNQTIRTTESAATTEVVITITGIAQQSLTFDQVILGLVDWIPAENFEDGSQYRQANRYSRQRTKTSSRNRLEDEARIMLLNFWNLTEDEFLDLQHLCDQVSTNGYVLIELDSANASEHDAFLADCSIVAHSSNGPNIKQCQLQTIEKNT